MADATTLDTPFFREPKPVSVRLWHWLTFLFFLTQVTTVLLASTLFKAKDNIAMVQAQVKENGGSVTHDQAWSVAHEYSDKLWMVHKYSGYVLCFLLLWRIIAEITMSKEKGLGTRIQKALTFQTGDPEKQHYLLVQYGYIIFYTLLFVMALTGLVLAFEDVKWLDPIHKPSMQIHALLQYFFYAYIVIHLFGVIRADLVKYNGIVSRMINGR